MRLILKIYLLKNSKLGTNRYEIESLYDKNIINIMKIIKIHIKSKLLLNKY